MSKRNAVQNSPYADEARELLQRGHSPEQARATLVQRHGDNNRIPSVKSLKRFANSSHVRTATAGSSAAIDRAVEVLRQPVDRIQALDDTITILHRRLLSMWLKEQETGEQNPHLDQTARTLAIVIRQRNATARHLGLEGDRAQNEAPQDPGFSDETADALIQALRWQRELFEPPQAEDASVEGEQDGEADQYQPVPIDLAQRARAPGSMSS